jgi:NAD-dependent deacetylase
MVILSGAGISQESGLKTFRDSDGLWMGYDVYEVASPQGWKNNQELVLEFYNQRRKEVAKALPNAAHEAIAELQNYFDVNIITQNIDDLHERAGSKNVLHLHGEIFKMRSEKNESSLYEIKGNIKKGDLAKDGAQFRPHVVWFGEKVPLIEEAKVVMSNADIFILIGTSLQVYPASGLIDYLPLETPKFIIDKNPPYIPAHHDFQVIEKSATEGMLELKQKLESEFLKK